MIFQAQSSAGSETAGAPTATPTALCSTGTGSWVCVTDRACTSMRTVGSSMGRGCTGVGTGLVSTDTRTEVSDGDW